jgi:antitoxin component YwqK of YwqJK toxin-antitoxin module
MKKRLFLSILTTIAVSTAYAQSDVRTVIKTPKNGHTMYGLQGPKDKVSLSYLDEEKTPFTGKFIEKDSYDDVLSERNYVKGVLNGDVTYWTRRGETVYISTKGTYKNGKLIGEYTEWWRPNHKKKELFYDEKGELHGKTVLYEGFSVEEPTTIQFYKHGVRDGTWTWFYSGGKINRIQNYQNGKENGESLQYYENGNKKFQVMYVNDKKSGLLSEWYENGQLSSTCEYTNSQKSGLLSEWYKNGQLSYTCEYAHDEKNGKEVEYYENGQIKREGAFVNGNKKGRFIWYKKDGTISEETTFQ